MTDSLPAGHPQRHGYVQCANCETWRPLAATEARLVDGLLAPREAKRLKKAAQGTQQPRHATIDTTGDAP